MITNGTTVAQHMENNAINVTNGIILHGFINHLATAHGLNQSQDTTERSTEVDSRKQ